MKKTSKIVYPKIVYRPTKVEFYTKTGEPLRFKAYETVPIEELTGKELVKWLRKEGFKNLAKSLEKVLKAVEKL